ncbi:polysaccharide deacetylase family protein [Rubrivirga sp.]|uniref:polysaccharide deacetylase family protein n=1 Tax=Rubrivirga sp. TaxID=1885344 RepID=UPI003B516296
MTRLLLIAAVTVASACAQEAPAPEPAAERTMAVTIDDLPFVGLGGDLAHQQRVTRDLLAQIAAAGVPVTGFVNEGKLDVEGERRARTALVQAWVDAGLDLGNHTRDHPSLFDTPLAAFQDQVRRGAPITNRLLAARGDSVRYFRHPYLNTGPDLETKRAFEAWLVGEGYTVAPVTHDNAEYVYARAYDRAAGDQALQARIADAYVAYMDTTAGYYEALGRDLFGREIAHVLLIHANALNADHLGALLAMFERRGYGFVSLDRALADPVYQSDDTYAGRAGISWLQRWALTRGLPFGSEPPVDPWVEDVAYPEP